MNILEWIQKWYLSVCDEQWADYYGIKIETLDNPGWFVQIDILETELENKSFQEISSNLEDEDGNDWFICKVENGMFLGFGDPSKLNMILEIFRNWVQE